MTEPRTEPLFQARGLAVRFAVRWPLTSRLRRQPRPSLRAVDGVDLYIRRGETLALVGESGSGKSTLARAIVGVTPTTTGQMRFDGQPMPQNRSRAERRRIQMVFQDPHSSLNPRMTVGRMLRELLRAHRIVPRHAVHEAALELVELVGLGAAALDAYPRQFSGGQRQRVAIARALALHPDLLVADEPVSALDTSIQATILELLRELQGEFGLTMLFIAHNLAVVRHLCDRVAVMYLGRIVEVAPTEELFRNPRHPYTQGLLRAIPRLIPGTRSQTVALQGDPPSPLSIPSGCRFHPRCPIAAPICAEQDPVLAAPRGSNDGHSAACHFAWVSHAG